MAATISPRNGKSQPEIFLREISLPVDGLLQCTMAKRALSDVPDIYLGDWLDLFGVGYTEAGEIAGCGQSYISNIAAGRKSNINVLYLLRLSEHFGVNINDFYRPLPSKSQLAALDQLSPKAQAAVLSRKQQKA
jgi:hypothetical protein